MLFLYIVVSPMVTLVVAGVYYRTFILRGRRKLIRPYGTLVDVFGGSMHLYTMGSGNTTVVLLPGIGTPLPSADFAP